jgi:uncharacterized surface protein with fasciclin (FAS1) repeats
MDPPQGLYARRQAIKNFQQDYDLAETGYMDLPTAAKIRELRGLMTLPESVRNNASLSTLATALQAGGVVNMLDRDGLFTLFAPTNDAFAKISDGTLGTLLVPSGKSSILNILNYHVVRGIVPASSLYDGQEIITMQGRVLKVTVSSGKVYINGAQVLMSNIATKNGIIHTIDTVLMP